MEVERLSAVLEATGLGTFQAQMAAADRVTGGTKDQLRALAEISKVATEALKHVKVTATQAAESDVSAQAILSGVKGIGEEARQAARDLDRVHLSQAQAMETRLAAAEEVRSLKEIEHQAVKTRVATSGGGGPGMAGVGRGILLPAAIGGAALLAPAAGPAALGLLAGIPVLAATGAGALGTLALAFGGVTKAIGGNKKAFDDLGPSAQQFVLTVRSLDGWFDKLKQTAAGAMFPGLTAGLKAALSPGTVGAITTAITEFGKAIGQAGEQWGRYFGSAQFQQIFGPLMAAGARNLGKMSDAALHLFDAFGVLGRAAIPLVGWMTQGVDAASRWVDRFTRAKDATGGLDHALGEAKTSLQLVGNLVGALAKVVYELGAALYPVSKVAVKDLTDGLSAVAKNSKAFNDIAVVLGGTLRGLTSVVKTLVSNLGGLRPVLDAAFGIAMLVMVNKLLAKLKSVAVTLGLIPAAAKKAATETDASLAVIGTAAETTTGKIAGIKLALSKIAGTVVTAAIILSIIPKSSTGQKALDAAGLGILGHLPVVGGLFTQAGALGNDLRGFLGESTVGSRASAAKSAVDTFKAAGGLPMDVAKGSALSGSATAGKQKMLALAQAALGTPYLWGGNTPGGFDCSGLVQWAFANGLNVTIPRTTYGQVAMGAQVNPNRASVGDVVFTNYGEGGKSGPGHEGLIVGFKNGQPIIEAAPHTGARVQTYSGYQAFTGGSAYTVRDLLAQAQATTDPSIYSPNPFPAAKPKKPRVPAFTLPALYLSAMNKVSANANRASVLGNTGGTAQRYLENELADLKTAEASLDKAISTDNGKHKAQLTKAETSVENKIRSVQKLIANAIIITGDALLPDKLKQKLAQVSAQFTADSDYAAVLTGQAADDYRKVLQKDLLSQAAVLQAEKQSLEQKLKTASGKQKTAIQDEIKNIDGQLSGVQQSILANLQANVQALQQKVSTLFGNVTSQFDTAFEQQTQALVDQLGKTFFQNGLQTPGEAALSAMQAQDQLQSQLDAIKQAKDQLATDQAGGLAGVVYDAATHITKNVYDPAAAAQVAADQKALQAAQRQYDEYTLGVRAAQERASADKAYAAQVAAVQATRQRAEDAMNKQLAALGDAFANGTGSIAQLARIAQLYGLQINVDTIPDFNNLRTASQDLKDAFQKLIDWISKQTGATPKIVTTSSDAATANARALGQAQAVATRNPTSANIAAAVQAAHDAGYTQSAGYLARAGIIPGFAAGGIVRARPGGTIVRVAEGGQDEEIGPVGGRGGNTYIELHVSALDPSSVDWGQVSDKVYAEFQRRKKRNGNTLNL